MSTWTTMDRKPRLGQQLVYLHCRSLFVGNFTRMRRVEAIQKFLEQRRNAIPLLFEDYPLEKVCLVAQKLLIDGIFASEALARQRFPLLFDPARLMLSDKASSEKASCEKAPSEKAPSEKAPSGQASSETKGSQIGTASSWPVAAGAQNGLETPESGAKSAGEAVTSDPAWQHTGHTSEAIARVPPPAPVNLPYATQHRILNSVQTALEGCCFDFAKELLPELIASQELEVPEQLELTQWISLLTQSASQLPRTVPAMGWEGFLGAAEKLQSTIARRMRTSINGMIGLLDDAIILTRSFKDVERTAWCQDVCEKLQSDLATIERHEKNLREILSGQLHEIASKRAELDCKRAELDSKRAELDSIETKAIARLEEVEKQTRAHFYEAMNQTPLYLNTPGEKALLINDGSESNTIKKEGASHLKGNLGNGRISDASAYDTLSKETGLSSRELQVVRQDPGKLDLAGLTGKSSWEPKRYSYSTPLEGPNFFSSKPTKGNKEISNSQSFSKQLAAEMTAVSLSGESSKLSQQADVKADVKADMKTEGKTADTLAKPFAAPLFGAYESYKDNSSVWDRARYVTLDSRPVRNSWEPAPP